MTETPAPAPGSRAAKPQQILNAARDLFLKEGFGATSMDAIAKRAGVSKATVYAHYTSKEELFAAMIDVECRRTWPELSTPYHGQTDPIEKIREVAQRYVRFIVGGYPVALLRTVAAEASRTPELGRVFYESAPGLGRLRFAELLQVAHARGVLDIPDPLHAADTFLAMLRGDIQLRCLVCMPLPSDEVITAHAKECAERFIRAYAPKASS
ncbi:MAG: TetR/AcrR family transcriptional regulator [Alphaproteobacteria bacterium]|nr:TetR/AcrR family transcriptional regulator [Alphaproteobacteria bacterium]